MVFYSKIKPHRKYLFVVLIVLLLFLINLGILFATPVGPSIVSNSSETGPIRNSAMINTTGGSITTIDLNATTQNIRWKAYVGNVSGTLTLDDGVNNTVFDWTLGAVVGEVYATRMSDTVQWTNINCSNMSHIVNEEIAINHTNNPNDNISTTFDTKTHDTLYIGTRTIAANSCYSIHTYVNDTNQSQYFEEVLLYDGTSIDDGDLIYATMIEQDVYGFDGNTYDFQMIVPENGLYSWTSSIAYYFYVELT